MIFKGSDIEFTINRKSLKFGNKECQVTDLEPGDFVHTFGDVHLYNNHIEQAKEQLSRDLRSLPTIIINPNIKNINDFKFEDFELVDYHPHPHIKASVSV